MAPRMYSGPLRPGERSAKVKGLTANRMRGYSSYYKPKSKAAPRVWSKARRDAYYKAKAQSKAKNQTGETKLQALVTHIDQDPISQVVGGTSPVYYKNYCIGNVPTNYSNFLTLGGMVWPQGTGNDERIGRYMYLKKATLYLNVALAAANRITGPTRFRVIVYKARRNNAPGTPLIDPNLNLLIDDKGNTFGMGTTINQTNVAFQVQHALANKKNYHIIKDKQFFLTPPVSTVQGGSNLVTSSSQTQNPEKNMTFNLGFWKKTSFGSNAPNANQPEDLNYSYCVSIFSMPVGAHNTITNNWISSTRGTVSACE